MNTEVQTPAYADRSLSADRARNRASVMRDTPLRQLADRLVAASEHLRNCHDAEWNRANAAHADAQADFRAAVEQMTDMPLAEFERAMGEI